jgi:hypothetical protein
LAGSDLSTGVVHRVESVPGGVCGGRLSTIRLVWFTRSIVAIEMVATIAAITAGFRRTPSILVNASVTAEFRFEIATRTTGPHQLA